MNHRYPIELLGLYTAPEHRVFGRKEEDVGGRDLLAKTEINLVANSGIKGDRFFRLRPDYNGHVTFFSQEVWDEVAVALNLTETIGPALTRRNIIVSGIDLKALYGAPFTIQGIQFMGTIHCAPCPAMNRAIGPGATAALRSRGGLRAQVKTSGILKLGATEIVTDIKFDPKEAAVQVSPPKLP